jgi:alpha-D-ribose 1-methylphosphonate 5-triphosphate diphosphatase
MTAVIGLSQSAGRLEAMAMRFLISGARVLRPEGFFDGDVCIENGCFEAPAGTGARSIDAQGLLALPGIVDLHGDAFERQLMPRPRVRFSTALALADTDRQLAANGITTAFHGITWSWEGGLRGRDTALELIAGIRQRAALPGVDHKVHLRFENHNVAEADEVARTIEAGHVDLLAFNDHLPDIARKCRHPEKRQSYAERAEVDSAAFMERLAAAQARAGELPAAVALLARLATENKIAMASHDDLTVQDRQQYGALGAHISEFPRSMEAIATAQDQGSPIILGAPNVLRGGSHCGAVGAADMVVQGKCDILASDYYYPALLQAPFVLAQRYAVPLAHAWALVSCNPADAAGLHDRGRIEAGKRADLLLVDDSNSAQPHVVACFVAGRLVYQATALH